MKITARSPDEDTMLLVERFADQILPALRTIEQNERYSRPALSLIAGAAETSLMAVIEAALIADPRPRLDHVGEWSGLHDYRDDAAQQAIVAIKKRLPFKDFVTALRLLRTASFRLGPALDVALNRALQSPRRPE